MSTLRAACFVSATFMLVSCGSSDSASGPDDATNPDGSSDAIAATDTATSSDATSSDAVSDAPPTEAGPPPDPGAIIDPKRVTKWNPGILTDGQLKLPLGSDGLPVRTKAPAIDPKQPVLATVKDDKATSSLAECSQM